MTGRAVTIVQARTGSSRLPGKALRPLAGRPMILHVMERAAAIGPVAWLATTTLPADDQLADVVVQAGYPVYRGAERDVLRRLREAAEVAQADLVLRVTADCPLLAPDVGRQVLDLLLEQDEGMASNDTSRSGWPDGLDVEAFPLGLLQAVDRALELQVGHMDAAKLWSHREHVTSWMRHEAPHVTLKCPESWQRVKLSVDTDEDFTRVQDILARIPLGQLGWEATREALLVWREQQKGELVPAKGKRR